MISFENLQRVSLSQIDTKDETYRITTENQKDDLSVSMRRVGLINPPTLLQRDDSYTVICGFRRVMAARKLQWNELPARVVKASVSHLTRIKLAIADNASQRQLNPIEVSSAIRLLISSIDSTEELPQILSDLGLPIHDSLVQKLLPVCDLPMEIQAGIISNDISLPAALMLASLDVDTAKMFASIFSQLKISLNKQREMLTLSREIAIREDRSTLSVLNDEAITATLSDSNLDRARKAALIRSYLKRKRFPAIVRAATDFEALVKSLQLGDTVKLIPPPDFEGTHYSLNLSFKNSRDLQQQKELIGRLLSHPEFCALINFTKSA